MKLNEFVAETLREIVSGVQQVQKELAQTGARINPAGNFGNRGQVSEFMLDQHGNAISIVQFDVGVTTTEGTDTKGGIGVFMGAINLGSQGASQSATSAVTRIKFAIPLKLPNT